MDEEELVECIRSKCKGMDDSGLKLFISSLLCTTNVDAKAAAFKSLKGNQIL
jgi:hypothetical protein